ncbi:MAG: SEC-C metal-binding domain-containing protein, partial [Thermodesulfobacteriota bacterium]
RGTDIVLGGNPEAMAAAKIGKDDSTDEYRYALEAARKICEEDKSKVIELGGLHIIGTERHESRRIDNQLRGRSGRQGDPGSTRFYLTLEDDLLRIFGGERISSVMDKLGMEEGVPIEHGFVTKAIENAQKKVEAHNFDIRKHILEYDDVMNKQREVVYGYRRQMLGLMGLREMVLESIEEAADDIVYTNIEEKTYPEDWDLDSLNSNLYSQFGLKLESERLKELGGREALVEEVKGMAVEAYKKKVQDTGEEIFSHLERIIMLQTLDTLWKDHLFAMDHLKEGIGLRGYAQKNPLQEYKKEGFDLFTDMIFRMKSEVVERLLKVQIAREEDVATLEPAERKQSIILGRGEKAPEKERPQTVHRAGRKIGRNEPCPCGSGKKYKKCCGAVSG